MTRDTKLCSKEVINSNNFSTIFLINLKMNKRQWVYTLKKIFYPVENNSPQENVFLYGEFGKS